jgi:hypothetical protein
MSEPSAVPGKVYVVLVNWNGWRETIECLESVLRMTGVDFTAVVCDNASEDGSLEKIRAWVRGDLAAAAANPSLRSFIEPPVSKPVKVAEASAGAARNPSAGARISLIQTGANLGYAAANNIGIRYALADPACSYVWLLNNDTLVTPRALAELVAEMARRPALGMCGPTLLSYHNPAKIWALGGASYSAWTGRHALLYSGCPAASPASSQQVEARLDFVSGAAMLVSCAFLESAGLLNEDYFLYHEEPDWALRRKPRFSLGFAPASVVYHKEGASIHASPGHASPDHTSPDHASPDHASPGAAPSRVRSDFWLTRSRILFTRTHCWYFLPTVFAVVAASFLVRLLKGRFRNCSAVWAGFRSGCAPHPSVASARRLADRLAS